MNIQKKFTIPTLFLIGSVIIFLLYFCLLAFHEIPERDVASRYAPMAEAFARGDYLYAFHPRIQSLHPFVAGIFAKILPVNGFTAAKCSSLLFYILGIFPLFALLKKSFNPNVAMGGIAIYLFASRLLILAYSGLRESHKIFAILLLAYAAISIWKDRDRLIGYLLLGFASGLSVCIRNDLVLYAVSILFLCSVLDARQHKFAWRSAAAVGTAFLAGFPELIVNYFLCGYAVPGSRFIVIFEKIFQTPPTLPATIFYGILGGTILYFLLLYSVVFLLKWKYGKHSLGILSFAGLSILVVHTAKAGFLVNAEMTGNFISGVFQGLFPVWGGVALATILCRIWKKEWTDTDTFLLTLVLIYLFEQIGQILFFDRYLYVSQRYLLPVTPLFFGWCALGVLCFWERGKQYLPEKFRNKVLAASLVLAGALFCLDAASPLLKSRTRKDALLLKSAVATLSGEIRKDYKGPAFRNEKISPFEYQNNVMPRIYFDCESKLTVAAYFAGGRIAADLRQCEYLVSSGKSAPQNFILLKKEIRTRRGSLTLWKRTDL